MMKMLARRWLMKRVTAVAAAAERQRRSLVPPAQTLASSY